VARDLGLLLVVALVTGLSISLPQGAVPRDLASALYVLLMGLLPFLFSLVLTGAAAGLHRFIRHSPLPYFRFLLWSAWVMGNLLLLFDQKN
jgi:hypothetical protein